ncbi:MAG: hypothetical protein ACKOCM_10610 [Cyanobacteriota bacterium]
MTSLPDFLAKEQIQRQNERRRTLTTVKRLTNLGRHREAAELWNDFFEQSQAA